MHLPKPADDAKLPFGSERVTIEHIFHQTTCLFAKISTWTKSALARYEEWTRRIYVGQYERSLA